MQQTVCKKDISTETYDYFTEGVSSCSGLQHYFKSANFFYIDAIKNFKDMLQATKMMHSVQPFMSSVGDTIEAV